MEKRVHAWEQLTLLPAPNGRLGEPALKPVRANEGAGKSLEKEASWVVAHEHEEDEVAEAYYFCRPAHDGYYCAACDEGSCGQSGIGYDD